MTSVPFSLYCKSYRTDAKRTRRLALSVDKFNVDKLPFFVSVPETDMELFQQFLGDTSAILITDESIIAANPRLDESVISALHGGTSQQIVKSEFWRTGYSDAYLCLDSDSFFIRPFSLDYFISSRGVPFTVIDEAHELLDTAISLGKISVLENFRRETKSFKNLFDRVGRDYSFGPNPVIWSSAVWKSLEKEYLIPRGMSFYDAIMQAPIDANWYGEALLKYQAIPLIPVQSLFKVYHYAWQLDHDLRSNVGEKELATIYSGVIYQSAWDRVMDWPAEPGNWASKLARRIRRRLGRA
jgi:hypothetical protein